MSQQLRPGEVRALWRANGHANIPHNPTLQRFDMRLGWECVERLSHLLAASAVCGLAALTHIADPIGIVEAALGAASLAVVLGRERAEKYRRIMSRAAREIEKSTEDWIAVEFRNHPDARADVVRAINGFNNVIPKIPLSSAQIVHQGLRPDRIAEYLLDRAAALDATFADISGNVIARQIFRNIAAKASEALRSRPEVQTEVYQALLEAHGVHERHLDRQDEVLSGIQRTLASISAEKGVPLAALQAILSRMGDVEPELDVVRIQRRLWAKAEEYLELQARLIRLSNDDPKVRELRANAARWIEQGSFDVADQLLSFAEQIDLEAVFELESIARQRRISAASTRGDRGAAARLRLAYRIAAGHYSEAATILPSEEGQRRFGYLLEQAKSLQLQGKEFEDESALAEAIGLYRGLVDLTNDPNDRGAALHNLATALTTLGDRKSDTRLLREAIKAFAEALKTRTHERAPLSWAASQNSLGITLGILAEREGSSELLKASVDALRESLKERTHERAPQDWAMTQNNLGIALAILGQMEGSAAYLRESVTAYGEALKETTVERAPLDWSMTKCNLASAVKRLGLLEDGSEKLEQAVAIYREALIPESQRMPEQWAMMNCDLANALVDLGERKDETALFREAIDKYGAALKVCTRERVPLQWAMIQHNLGAALQTLGERENDMASLRDAVAAFRAALAERTRNRVPPKWAMTQNNLGNALTSLGERANDSTQLEAAIEAYRDALTEYTPEAAPSDWALTKNNMGSALIALSGRSADKAAQYLLEAVACLEDALTVRRADTAPSQHATTMRNLIKARNALTLLASEKH